ncbi:unnamed protein product [Schistocephalus solidus]|uniref:X-box-binding protein 1 n=1 Tax=Schistocephalus solidus TaxID=70667 RepID=A0A3P7ELF8_SCHSO|nr:unnamed protein product [Schistocephalus solidus]
MLTERTANLLNISRVKGLRVLPPTLAFVTASGDVYNSYTRRAITSERKRAKLDFLTEEEKAIRRKILNREAAQKARDRKKDSIKMMEQCIAQLRTENRLLRRTNVALREKCRDHEQKFISLRTELDVLTQNRAVRVSSTHPSAAGRGSLSSGSPLPTPSVHGFSLPSFTSNTPDPDFLLPELSTIEVSSEVTIPSPETLEADAHEVDIAPIVSSSSVYDLIYQSFCGSEATSDVILSPSSTSDESLDDILQCLEADGYCSDALESTIPSLTPEYSFVDTP